MRARASMQFVLVHGWGFDASIWTPLIGRLGEAKTRVIDLGFAGNAPPADIDVRMEPVIAIGHSLGVLWLLKQGGRELGGQKLHGLVSIQGFDRYCPHVSRARVMALKRGIDRDASGTMGAFWRSCGAPDFASLSALNEDRLREGLDWLLEWDARGEKASLDCPVLCLATRDDAIVPPAMSRAVWGDDNLIWRADGGHVLPLKHPDWCAAHVLEFADTLAP
ncbi:MAG: alpha/beta fold hydrolase [Pseudomonadota bacterium]